LNKKPKISIFSTSSKAKKLIEDKVKQSDFKGIEVEYVNDLADEIKKDYV
jgi:hypothetical protein